MDTLKEIWKPSPLAPDHVEVSSFGRVRTLERVALYVSNGKPRSQRKKGHILSPWLAHNGYMTVTIKVDGRGVKYTVHRLVASAFCENFDPALSVNHIDGKKTNNLPYNLEWITLSANTTHQWGIGLLNIRGEKHPSSKLTDYQAKYIRDRMIAGESPTKLSRAFGISVSLCYKIKYGDRRNHQGTPPVAGSG